MATLAENYFEKYTASNAAAFIASLPGSTEKAFEDDWLDFKGGQLANDYFSAAPKDKGKAKENVEKLWSELVGQFANNEGGVVVWGVDAKKAKNAQGNEVDAANGLSPISDAEGFKSLLIELGRFVTDPPVSGIRHEVVRPDETQPGGFVVSLIPQGKQKPYRSEKAGKRFLIRSGDSKLDCSVSLLRALFAPQRQALISLQFERIAYNGMPDYVRKTPARWALGYTLTVKNDSNTTIEGGLLKLVFKDATLQTVGGKNINILDLWGHLASLKDTLHPGMERRFADILITPESNSDEDIVFGSALFFAKDSLPIVATFALGSETRSHSVALYPDDGQGS